MATQHDAITDVPGIKVGHWTDLDAATGCTVVLYEPGVVPGVDVRGAAPGTHETDLLKPGFAAQALHAVVLTGGSVFGLASTAGVLRWCEEHGVGIDFGRQTIPIVSGAVIFDLNIGLSNVRPTADSGYAAADVAQSGPVPEGSVGAGTGATVAKLMGANRRLKGGIGTASEALDEGIVVGAIVAVNSIGDVVDAATGGVIAAPRSENGGFLDTMAGLRSGSRRAAQVTEPASEGNTTIAVVATNARLTKEQANRLATVAHDGFARAIRPVHTSGDGDTIFAMATGEVDIAPGRITALEAFAALAVERAIHKGVLAATSLADVPSVTEWMASRQ